MTPQARLARIRLNTESRPVQRDLRDAGEMHRTVMRLVDDSLGDSARQKAGLLYRVDETPSGSMLLVQARNLNADGFPVSHGSVEIKDLAPMFRALRKGMTVRYRIAVNASKQERLKGPDNRGKRGAVIPLVGKEADAWWARKAEAAGLHLAVATPTSLAPARTRDDRKIRHALIRYDGIATVTDPAALTDAVLTGIGRGKPYGAGLLSLAPAGTP